MFLVIAGNMKVGKPMLCCFLISNFFTRSIYYISVILIS